MNWKVFFTAFISAIFISIPQNMLSCGPSENPYDYFTSFFSRDLSETKGYQPFYYTALLNFYDDWMYDNNIAVEDDKIIQEWKQYAKGNISISDVAAFVYKITPDDVSNLSDHIKSNKLLRLPDSIRNNGMTRYFLSEKDIAALDYLLFAKKIEKFCTSADWDTPPERDSSTLNNYITQADNFYQKTADEFLKSKYAFQRCKLAFYNNRFQDCIRWYDENFSPANKFAVNQLALSYKAGSLFRSGKTKEAAYAFSKAFNLSDIDKKKNYLGFFWATDNANRALEKDFVTLANNNEDKADMLGLFALYGRTYRLQTMIQIYSLAPSSPMLDILAIREINKLEEQYLTPLLEKENGGKAFYFSWEAKENGLPKDNKQLMESLRFFELLANDTRISNRGLYYAGAAYIAFMTKDYTKAKTLITAAKSIKTSEKINDQLQLISLLTAANNKPTLDAETEKDILPAIQWLGKKAGKDVAYKLFFRNFFSQIIAQKYEQQKDDHRAALSYGVADTRFLMKTDENNYSTNGIEYIRNEMSTAQLLKLYELMTSKNAPAYEQYIIKHTSFTTNDLLNVIGTSFIRDFNFEKAIEWLKKAGKPDLLIALNYHYLTGKEITVNVNPFHDYINDWQRYEKPLAKPYTKLMLAEKLLQLQRSIDTAATTETKSKIYYQLASAFYNMSYYGNSWKAMAYYRSGGDWNKGNYKTGWEKEYYGVYKSREYYQKAYELTKNKEFKAACFLLVAKCNQRQIPMPAYNYNDYKQYEKDVAVFQKKFRSNPLFDTFKKILKPPGFINTLTTGAAISGIL